MASRPRDEVRCQQAWREQSAAAEHADLATIFQRGQIALQQGDLEAAETDFRKVLQSDPRLCGSVREPWRHWKAAKELGQSPGGLRHAGKTRAEDAGIRLNIGWRI